MREFYVHFSFYSEEYGNFDDISYRVMAKTPFEAREIAWLVCDQDSDTLFRSNIKQFAITWMPNLLDAGDYFYSHATDIKQYLGRLMNVTIPNDRIANNERRYQLDTERCSYLSALRTLDDVAKDLYADKGMIPPSIYEELHYAEKLCEQMGYGDKADALWERIDRAKKWDSAAIYIIRDMFRDGYTTLNGETELFKEHFSRNGIYPIHNKPDECDYICIYRWQNRIKVNSLRKIPFLHETDVIANSASHMDYGWQVLLLNQKSLNDTHQIPENQLWQMVDPPEQSMDTACGTLFVESLVTGKRMFYHKENFFGVLRPDIVAAFDFEALKKEYSVTYGESRTDSRIEVISYSGCMEDDEDELDR